MGAKATIDGYKTMLDVTRAGFAAQQSVVDSNARAGVVSTATAFRQRLAILTQEAAAVNAASVLAVMSLGIKAGESVLLIVDDEAVLRELADLVASDLDAALGVVR